jgi:hypothetical protein
MAQPLRQPAPDTRSYSERIRELVEKDYIGAARTLLSEALEQGEEDREILKWQRVLEPAVSKVSENKALDSDPTPNLNWIRQHREDYCGQWVALLEGELHASSPSLEEVLSDLEEKPLGRRVLLHYID